MKWKGVRLECVQDEKDLGVLISENLKFSKQVARAAATANRKLGMLKHTFKYWTERDIDVMEKVQRRATKLQ